MASVQLNVMVPETLMRELQTIREQRGVPVSVQVRRGVEMWIGRMRAPDTEAIDPGIAVGASRRVKGGRRG